MFVRALFAVLVVIAAWGSWEVWRLAAWRADVARVGTGMVWAPPAPARGAPDLTVVAFYDYACPYCAAAHRTLMAAAQDDGRVRVALRPLEARQSPPAQFAAVLTTAAGQQGPGAGAALHRAFLELGPPARVDDVVQAAERAGLDPWVTLATARGAPERIRGDLARSAGLLRMAEPGGRVPLFVLGGRWVYVPEGRMPTQGDFADMFALARGQRR